ncbi:MAG TPA: glycosyltransferase family 87 protein [Urbifossiella sp.]|jgi:hypothetical protein|nr:glycosyltransferase family 87 protein [Urbifossiella sp.]
MPGPAAPSAVRRGLVWVGAGAALILTGTVFDGLFRADLQAPLDFTEYWAAGRLNLHGQNPYDGTLVRDTQRALGLDATAIMMWNPPWTLTLVMPVGALPFRAGYGLWVLVNFGLVLLSAELLWRGFGRPAGRRGIAYVLTLGFVPTIFLIGSGQITGVVLVGLAGFLAAARAGRFGLAGAVGALTAVKPHLLGLFALMLVLDAIRARAGRRVVLAGVAVGVLACVPPTIANPDVWNQYLAATTGGDSADHHGLAHWEPPLAGWWLRSALPGSPFAVQFLPFLAVAVAFVAWHRRQPPTAADTVTERLPAVVGLSLLAAPYGVWQHDLVLLLVPVLATAARLATRSSPAGVMVGLTALLAANVIALVMMVNQAESKWYVWFTPVVLAGCWAAVRATAVVRRTEDTRTETPDRLVPLAP